MSNMNMMQYMCFLELDACDIFIRISVLEQPLHLYFTFLIIKCYFINDFIINYVKNVNINKILNYFIERFVTYPAKIKTKVSNFYTTLSML